MARDRSIGHTLPAARRGARLGIAGSALVATACVQSYGASGLGVTAFDGRTTGLAGVTVRTEVRLPRLYETYAGTEITGASQAWTPSSPDPDRAGQGQPAIHVSGTFGWIDVPDASNHFGWRLGLKAGAWHGALGDVDSRWSLDAGVEGAALIRIGPSLSPWRADETLSFLVPVVIPAVGAAPLVRLGFTDDSRFAVAYSGTVSVGFLFSSTVVP